jgi:integrase/recombinase XerD
MATQYKVTKASSDREIINLWLADKSKTTQVSYWSILKQFLEFLGSKHLNDVMLEDLQLWKRGLELRFKPTTVGNKVLVIKSLFSFCLATGYLSVNVGSFLKPPKTKETIAERILDINQVKKLIGSVKGDRDRLMLSLMYGCGLRVSEVIGLTWNDLRVHGEGGKATVFGKGSKTRVILIPDKLWQQLKEFEELETSRWTLNHIN